METSQCAPSTPYVTEIPPLFLDTTCTIDNETSSWETMYQLLESEGPKVIQRVATTDATTSSESSHYEAATSFLHRIVARTKILPYTKMVKWIIENINIAYQTFLTSRKTVIGSFTTEDLKKMYHIHDSQKVYNKAFLEHFASKNDVASYLIKQWISYLNKHKHEKLGMYSISSLVTPYSYIATMMCRLNDGQVNTTKFSVEWIPLIKEVVNSFIMDWGTILSNNITFQIQEFRQHQYVSTRVVPPFFMSSYIMDVVCSTTNFLTMGLKWSTQDPTPIHIYQRILWESNFHTHLSKICQGVILPIHQDFFEKRAPRLSDEAKIDFILICRWFGEEIFTYV